MATLKSRLASLEQRSDPTIKRWHCILKYKGQTTEEAVANYEAANGPIGPDDGSILRVIINKSVPAPREA